MSKPNLKRLLGGRSYLKLHRQPREGIKREEGSPTRTRKPKLVKLQSIDNSTSCSQEEDEYYEVLP